MLKKLTIQQYKSCETTIIEPNQGLTALIGVNGAGKTNILTAMNALHSPESIPLYKQENNNTVSGPCVIAVISSGVYDVELKIQPVSNIERPYDIVYEWKIAELIPEKRLFIPSQFIADTMNKTDIEKIKKHLYVNNQTVPDNVLEGFVDCIVKAKQFLKTIRYYSTTQFSEPSDINSIIDLIRPPQKLGPGGFFLYDLVKAKYENPDIFIRYLDLVGKNGIHLVDDLLIRESGINMPDDPLTAIENTLYIPLVKLNNLYLRFNQLSEGTFKTMALLFYLITDTGLILIEEPENSVHYKLLRDIIEIMKTESENKQIVFSTHSDYVLDMLKPEDIVFVENGADGTKAQKLPEYLSGDNYRGLRNYLENEGSLGQYWRAGGFDDR
jgi:predicted ATP-dependent endonuclease of OLD family